LCPPKKDEETRRPFSILYPLAAAADCDCDALPSRIESREKEAIPPGNLIGSCEKKKLKFPHLLDL
jgi:hypothetical protein